ncbi:hypothetical protein ACUTJJ_05220 [Agrobacterium sp. DKPNP3]|uniref:hypothetical protein n=1 Tax=Agrobacterium sp. DKPNP3 TaxID=3457323 RepID=UPI004044718F
MGNTEGTIMGQNLTQTASFAEIEMVLNMGIEQRNYCIIDGYVGSEQIIKLDLQNVDGGLNLTPLQMMDVIKACVEPALPATHMLFELFTEVGGRPLTDLSVEQKCLLLELEMMCVKKSFVRILINVGTANVYSGASTFAFIGFPDAADAQIFKLSSYHLDAF